MNEITRRQMIMAMTASPFALAGLTGCGGGGGGTANQSLMQILGIVTLPAGLTLPLTSLTVENGFSNSAIATDRSFKVSVVGQAEGPTLAWLRSADKSIYMGFINAANGVIDAASTAKVLLYFALGGWTVPPAEKGHLLELIAADSTFAPLVAAIESRTAINPFAITDGDPAVIAALQNSVEAIRSQTPSRAARINRGVMPVGRSATTRADDSNALLQITPDGLKSNVEVLHGDPALSFIATNHGRRHCKVITYEVGTENKEGVRTDYPKAKLAIPAVSLPSTRALGIMSTIFGFFKRDTAFVPVSTEPLVLKQTPDAAKTFFEVVVLGSSTLILPDQLQSSARYADELDRWHAELESLNLTSWLGDIVFGILLEVWGLHDLVRGDAALTTAMAAFRALEYDTWSQILILAGRGSFAEATKEFLLFSTKSAEHALRVRSALAALIPEFGGTIVAAEAAAGAQVCLKMFQTAFAGFGAIIGAVDIGAVLYDLANSEYIEYWAATLVRQDVRISPTTLTLKPGDEANFNAIIPGGIPGPFIYKWSVAASFAVLTDTAGGKSGKTFETSSNQVTLATTPSDRNDITVTVEAFKVGDGGARTSLGIAQAAVKMEEDVAFGSARIRLSNAPGEGLDPTLLRTLGRVRAQQIPRTAGAKRPILVESVHELVANFGPQNTILMMLLDFGNAIVKDQVVPLAFHNNEGMFMRLAGPTTGGARVNFMAQSGSLKVLEVSQTATRATIKFTATAAMAAQDAPELTFNATIDGWISDITLMT